MNQIILPDIKPGGVTLPFFLEIVLKNREVLTFPRPNANVLQLRRVDSTVLKRFDGAEEGLDRNAAQPAYDTDAGSIRRLDLVLLFLLARVTPQTLSI